MRFRLPKISPDFCSCCVARVAFKATAGCIIPALAADARVVNVFSRPVACGTAHRSGCADHLRETSIRFDSPRTDPRCRANFGSASICSSKCRRLKGLDGCERLGSRTAVRRVPASRPSVDRVAFESHPESANADTGGLPPETPKHVPAEMMSLGTVELRRYDYLQ